MGLAAAILVALAAVVILAVLLPWQAEVTLATAPPAVRLTLRPLNGLGPAIPIRRGTTDHRRRARPDRPRRRPKKRPRLARLQGTGRLISGLVASVGLGRFALSGRIGLPDPADTGTLYGLLQPLIQTGRAAGARIDLAPDFAAPRFDLAGRGTVILRPARLAAAILRFGWTNRREVFP